MARKKAKGRKGTFGDGREGRPDHRLPLTRAYLMPAKRRPLVLAGLAGLALFVAWTTLDLTFFNAGFVSNGPLSSSHATLDSDCAACHTPLQEVSSEKCSVCHEKLGDDLGIYTWAAHYVYRSADFNRIVPSPDEENCAACHQEHGGRDAPLTRVADQQCRTCHDWNSFNDGHPPFAATALKDGVAPRDPAGLVFPHIHHVRELMNEQGLVDVERTCLACHEPDETGRGFKAMTFDRHCDRCHLVDGTRTLPVPLAVDGDIGVASLEQIRDGRAPGTDWAFFMSPAEFRVRGGQVVKSPVYHQDPWILENLKRLRRRLFEDPGLADLLRASAQVPPDQLPVLYEEAIQTLEGYAQGLRARPEPEIQEDLNKIDTALEALRRAVADPTAPLDESAFFLALERPRTDLSEEEVDVIYEVMENLAFVCLTCHEIEDDTIARVQADQRAYRRAEFDHGAHVIEVRCLECHTEIPFDEYLQVTAGETPPPGDPAVDNAEIQNLPRMGKCQECHAAGEVANRCTTCHLFHPDKGRHADFLLYAVPEGGSVEADAGGNA